MGGISGWFGRGCFGVVLATAIIFSIMRGTDKEFADVFIGGGAAGFVMLGRSRALGRGGFEIMRRHWYWALIAVVFVFVAQGLSTERKTQRLGAYASRGVMCVNGSRICADLENPWIAWLPQQQRFGFLDKLEVPCGRILIGERHIVTPPIAARPAARFGMQHQRQQAERLGFLR